MESPSDEALLKLAADGDGDAMSALLTRHGGEVRRVIARKVPKRFQSVLSADDVMQHTYTDAFMGIRRFVPKGENAFVRWLTRIAQRNLLDAIEMLEADKRGGGRQRVEGNVNEASYVAMYEWLAATSGTPSRHAARSEMSETMRTVIAQLPDDYRRLIEMYDLEGRPISDVAKELGRSEGAVYMLRGRAHRRLQELMGTPSRFFTDAS
jgi:RNA polymerase sigma-70 factor (subfamily 1)